MLTSYSEKNLHIYPFPIPIPRANKSRESRGDSYGWPGAFSTRMLTKEGSVFGTQKDNLMSSVTMVSLWFNARSTMKIS